MGRFTGTCSVRGSDPIWGPTFPLLLEQVQSPTLPRSSLLSILLVTKTGKEGPSGFGLDEGAFFRRFRGAQHLCLRSPSPSWVVNNSQKVHVSDRDVKKCQYDYDASPR